MCKLVLGVLIGFLVAASAALAYDVTFPSRLRVQAHALVDEIGNVLLGSTPAKIEVTNWPSGGGTVTGVRDSNGALVGTIGRAYTLGGPAPIVRDIGGVLIEMSAGHFALDGNSGGLTFYFESNDCTGPAYLPPTSGFYPQSVRVGTTLRYASAPPSPVNVNSNKNTNTGSSCIVSPEGQIPMSLVASLDLTQFPPPYYLE